MKFIEHSSFHYSLKSNNCENNVLFLSEKWCGSDPNLGLTNTFHNLFETIDETGLYDISIFFYDAYFQATDIHPDEYLINLLKDDSFDFIILCWHPYYEYNVSKSLLKKIAKTTPLITFWFDSSLRNIFEMADQFSYFAYKNILLDCSHAPKTYNSAHPEKYLHLWTPQAKRLYFYDKRLKETPLSFIGTITSDRSTYRSETISYLKNNGIEITVSGGQRTNTHLSPEDYAKSIRKSIATINFCKAINTNTQIKGRVFEALFSGCLLFEEENLEITNWLIPFEHYIPFSSQHDLLEKIMFYQRNTYELKKIVENAHNFVRKNLSNERFWELALN